MRKKLVSEFYVAVPVKSDIGFNFRICQSITYPVPCTQQSVYIPLKKVDKLKDHLMPTMTAKNDRGFCPQLWFQ